MRESRLHRAPAAVPAFRAAAIEPRNSSCAELYTGALPDVEMGYVLSECCSDPESHQSLPHRLFRP